MAKLLVLSDEECRACGGLGYRSEYASGEREIRRRCDTCRGTGGTWLPLSEALEILRQEEDDAQPDGADDPSHAEPKGWMR